MGTTRDIIENERPVIDDVAATEGDVIGINQTWQDLTASRTAGVTYTNTSGQPIQMSVSAISNGDFFINGSPVAQLDGGIWNNINVVVPDGDTYSITAGANINNWHELRA